MAVGTSGCLRLRIASINGAFDGSIIDSNDRPQQTKMAFNNKVTRSRWIAEIAHQSRGVYTLSLICCMKISTLLPELLTTNSWKTEQNGHLYQFLGDAPLIKEIEPGPSPISAKQTAAQTAFEN